MPAEICISEQTFTKSFEDSTGKQRDDDNLRTEVQTQTGTWDEAERRTKSRWYNVTVMRAEPRLDQDSAELPMFHQELSLKLNVCP